jgi:hypothetical protein
MFQQSREQVETERKTALSHKRRKFHPSRYADVLARTSEYFTITVEDLEKRLQQGVCEVTGLPFHFAPRLLHVYGEGMDMDNLWLHSPERWQSLWAPTLALRDPKLGYTPENVVLMCAGVDPRLITNPEPHPGSRVGTRPSVYARAALAKEGS